MVASWRHNPPCIRYCVGSGRLVSISAQQIVDEILNRMSVNPLQVTWRIIRKKFDVRAHDLARHAAKCALQTSSIDAAVFDVTDLVES